jgi:hypothetical protein
MCCPAVWRPMADEVIAIISPRRIAGGGARRPRSRLIRGPVER